MFLTAVKFAGSLLLAACGSGASAGHPAHGSLPSFAWKAPVARMNGEPISSADTVTYHLHVGLRQGRYFYSKDLGTALSYTITPADVNEMMMTLNVPALPAETYYFSITAVDQDGFESGYSTDVGRVLP